MDSKEIIMDLIRSAKHLMALCMGCFSFWAQAQDTLFQEEVMPEIEDRIYQHVFPVYNTESKETAVFLREESKSILDLQVFSSSKETKELIRGKDSGIVMPKFTGVTYSKNLYHVFCLDRSGDRVGITQFNTDNQEVSSKVVDLEMVKYERVLTYFESGQQFYFVSIEKETSHLYFHIFKNGEFIEKKKVELKNEDFPHFLKDNLYNCVAFNNGTYKPVDLINPLYAGKEEDYFFVQDHIFHLVANTNRVVKVDLNNFNSKTIHIPINYKEDNESYKKSLVKNVIKQTRSQSTICDNYFFRVNLVDLKIQLQVYNLDNGEQLLDKIIDQEHLDFKVIYDTEDSRDLDHAMKTKVLFMALQTGEFGFRVVKEKEDYHIHLGKVAKLGFWEIFDDKTIPSKRNARFRFDQRFRGVFADFEGKYEPNYGVTPHFVKKKVQSRYFDIPFNPTQGIRTESHQEKTLGTNRLVTFTDGVNQLIYSYKHNGYFQGETGLNYVSYHPKKGVLVVYKIDE